MKQENPHTTLQEQNSPEQIQSHTIDMLRFPLAVMVIFIHMTPAVTRIMETNFTLFSGKGILNTTEIMLSHVLARVAVPTFFLISGFLFFQNLRQWSWTGYKNKIKSRIHSLLIPYLLWNFCCFLMVVIGMVAINIHKGESLSEVFLFVKEKNWHIFYDYNVWGHSKNWLNYSLHETAPFDLPLWFLRDLIIVTLLTPIIYYFVKKVKVWGILILFLAYISKIWILLPGFSITAFFFFSLGSYFALNKINIVTFSKRFKNIFIISSFILLCICTAYDGSIIGQNVRPFFICCGIFTCFYIASIFVECHHLKPNKLLVSSCFFIYAFHVIPIRLLSPLSQSKEFMHLIIPGHSTIEEGMCYLITPFLAAFICILTLIIFKKLSPKLALLFSGNR